MYPLYPSIVLVCLKSLSRDGGAIFICSVLLIDLFLSLHYNWFTQETFEANLMCRMRFFRLAAPIGDLFGGTVIDSSIWLVSGL